MGNSGFLTSFISEDISQYESRLVCRLSCGCVCDDLCLYNESYLFLSNAIKSIDYQTIEAAKNMGASPWGILTKIVFPVLKPVLTTLSVLLFATGLGCDVCSVNCWGERLPNDQSPMILTFANSMSSRDLAALLAIFLGIAQIILLYFITRAEKKGFYMSVSKVKTKIVKQKIENKAANFIVHFFAYVLFAIYVLPIGLLLSFSFTDTYSISTGTLSWEHFTLENYIKILTDASAYEPFLISDHLFRING